MTLIELKIAIFVPIVIVGSGLLVIWQEKNKRKKSK